RAGQRLTFATDALPGETFTGTVLHLNPGADPGDRSVRVTAEVPNPDGRLRGGLFVTGRIRTASRPQVLQVPRSALVAWDAAAGTAEVFVVEGGVARRRAVATGAAQGDRVEVAEGLDAGTPVVTRGGFNLKDGDRVTVILAGKDA
ncbi:MAG: efflux RND transporter periplasmic adaptor subunit, partial [Deferrisomatales bacterium]